MKQLINIRCILFIIFGMAVFTSCVKEIEPEEFTSYASKVVVDGRIEAGGPPVVLLTKSVGYFEETGKESIKKIIIRDAQVSMKWDQQEIVLEKLCSSEIPDSLIDDIGGLLSIPIVSMGDLVELDVCIYTTSLVFGEIGEKYKLVVYALGNVLEATTSILPSVPLDSVWFARIENSKLGYIGGLLHDPIKMGNAYRMMTQRISSYPNGEIKDFTFLPSRHSVFDDRLINGKKFEFFIERGMLPGSEKEDDKNEQKNLFSLGDSVIVKFVSINQSSFKFFRALEMQEISKGNPFAAPSYIKSNVENGLGIWAGYSSFYDTVVAR